MALAYDAGPPRHARFILESTRARAAESGNSFPETRTKSSPSEGVLESPTDERGVQDIQDVQSTEKPTQREQLLEKRAQTRANRRYSVVERVGVGSSLSTDFFIAFSHNAMNWDYAVS